MRSLLLGQVRDTESLKETRLLGPNRSERVANVSAVSKHLQAAGFQCFVEAIDGVLEPCFPQLEFQRPSEKEREDADRHMRADLLIGVVVDGSEIDERLDDAERVLDDFLLMVLPDEIERRSLVGRMRQQHHPS